MEGEARNNKRPRDESPDTPETKRLRVADIILEILDDDDDDVGSGGDSAVDNLAHVMKSLEEEITAPVTAEVVDAAGARQLDLGYLLEASDDDLGLPPPADGPSSSSPSTDGGYVAEVVGDGLEMADFDRVWRFEDEISPGPYEGLEQGIPTDFYDDGVIFDGGLFGYSDEMGCGPSDYEDGFWRTESQPAI